MADVLKTYRLDEETHKLIASLMKVYGSRRKVIEAALAELQMARAQGRVMAAPEEKYEALGKDRGVSSPKRRGNATLSGTRAQRNKPEAVDSNVPDRHSSVVGDNNNTAPTHGKGDNRGTTAKACTVCSKPILTPRDARWEASVEVEGGRAHLSCSEKMK